MYAGVLWNTAGDRLVLIAGLAGPWPVEDPGVGGNVKVVVAMTESA